MILTVKKLRLSSFIINENRNINEHQDFTSYITFSDSKHYFVKVMGGGKRLGGKRHGGQKARGGKSQGTKDRGAKDRGGGAKGPVTVSVVDKPGYVDIYCSSGLSARRI